MVARSWSGYQGHNDKVASCGRSVFRSDATQDMKRLSEVDVLCFLVTYRTLGTHWSQAHVS